MSIHCPKRRAAPAPTVTVGDLDSVDTPAWDALVAARGSPFQTTAFLRAVETAWPGERTARHVAVSEGGVLVAAIPAYLERGCARLRHYRHAAPGAAFDDPILLSHAFVGHDGSPAADDRARRVAVEAFAHAGAADGAAAVFAGVDGRDAATLRTLRDTGFALGRFQTLMCRRLDPGAAEDPTAALPQRRRATTRNQVAQAQRAGVTTRPASAADDETVAALVESVPLDHGMPPDFLPRAFVDEILRHRPPGLGVTVAEAEGRAIGALLHFEWRDTHVGWLAGHRHADLRRFRPSHMLVHETIRAAARAGCTEGQAGRSPSRFKRQFGYEPVPLLLAVRGADREQHERACRWVAALERHHVERYGRWLS